MNRLDELIVFHPLGREHIVEIIGILFNELTDRMSPQKIDIEISDEVKEFVAEKGFDPEFGARQLQRTIRKYIEDPLSEEMLKQEIIPPVKIKAALKDDRIVFKKTT